MAYLIVAVLSFGVFYLIDRGFTRLFRSKAQHRSGLSVRLHKRYALFGLFFALVGIVGAMTALGQSVPLLVGALLVMALGVALIVYYLSFGIYYDDDTFLSASFGKKSAQYRFSDIRFQQLYVVQGGGLLVELHLSDGTALSLQQSMEGFHPFLDHAFSRWCSQRGQDPEKCAFHDPSQGLWFPREEAA